MPPKTQVKPWKGTLGLVQSPRGHSDSHTLELPGKLGAEPAPAVLGFRGLVPHQPLEQNPSFFPQSPSALLLIAQQRGHHCRVAQEPDVPIHGCSSAHSRPWLGAPGRDPRGFTHRTALGALLLAAAGLTLLPNHGAAHRPIYPKPPPRRSLWEGPKCSPGAPQPFGFWGGAPAPQGLIAEPSLA